jgi:GT2 family glycosyltransferase
VAGRVANALPEDPYAETSQVLIDYLCSYYNRSAQRARFATSNNLSFPLDGFRRLGGFDPDFTGAGAEDRDLCERWTSGGGGLVFADDALVDHFHAMSLRSFVKQHLGYGRGAHRFHRKRTGSALSAVSPEPLRFYVDLLLYPARHGRRSPRFVALMLVSQLANATGFFLAALSPAPRIVTVPAPEGRP